MQNRQAARSPDCLLAHCDLCATVATRVRLPFPHSDTTSILANWRSKTDFVWLAVVAASQKWAHHEKVSTFRILLFSCPRRHVLRDRAIQFCRKGSRGNTQGACSQLRSALKALSAIILSGPYETRNGPSRITRSGLSHAKARPAASAA